MTIVGSRVWNRLKNSAAGQCLCGMGPSQLEGGSRFAIENNLAGANDGGANDLAEWPLDYLPNKSIQRLTKGTTPDGIRKAAVKQRR